MPNTESFYVSKKNELKKTEAPHKGYLISGEAKYIIEVFGYNHEVVANEVKTMVENAGMENKLFSIRVDTR